MKNLTVDKFLTEVFRETAEKSGWNIMGDIDKQLLETYRKNRQLVPSVKRRTSVTKVKSFN